MGQELLLEKDSCGPVSLGVDGGMRDGGWRGDQEQPGTAFPLCVRPSASSSLCSELKVSRGKKVTLCLEV